MAPAPSSTFFELEAILPELASHVAKYLDPTEVPVLASASRHCRALFHTPCNNYGLAVAERHVLFWAACRNVPCAPEETPYDDLDFSRLSIVDIQDFGSKPLHYAIRRHHMKIVRDLLEHGANMESLDPRGMTPLLVALNEKNDDAAALLVSRGAKMPVPFPPVFDTPLHKACAGNLPATVKALLDTKRVDINSLNSNLQTPLHIAAGAGHENFVELLVDHGANPNIRDDAGDTPLHILVRNVNNPVCAIKKLLSAGACLDAPGSKEETIFHLLCKHANDSEEVADLFRLTGWDCNVEDNSGDTPLMVLVKEKHEKPRIGVALVAGGANILAREEKTQRTPLHWATDMGHLELIKILVRAGADVVARDRAGKQPWELGTSFRVALSGSFCRGDPEFAMPLRNLFASISNVARPTAFAWIHSGGKNPVKLRLVRRLTCLLFTMTDRLKLIKTLQPYADVYQALTQRNNRALKDLLDAGAEVNHFERSASGEPQGITLLIHAIRNGAPASVRLLLEHGADVERRGPDGYTPLLIAVVARNTEAVNWILRKGANTASTAKGCTAMHLACMTGMPEMVTMLKEAGAEIDALDGEGNTPLHLAIQSMPRMVAVLLEHGANPNAVGPDHLTPLHLAARSFGKDSFWDICEQLLVHGACGKSLDNNGRTPLHILCQIEDDGADFSRILGLGLWEINLPDVFGKTPLHYLASNRVDRPLAGQALIAFGADINAIQPVTMETPLERAALQSNFGLSRVLLLAGANLNAIFLGKANFAKFFDTLITSTTEAEREKLILQTVYSAFETENFVAFSLSQAAEFHDRAVLKCFRNLQVDFGDSRRPFGATLLYSAVADGEIKMVNLLLSVGVGTEHVTCEGHTALLLALEKGFENVAIALIAHKANCLARNSATDATALHLACSRGLIDAARIVLSAGVDPNARNLRGETPLHVVAGFDPEMVKLLLVSGANPMAMDSSGDTPLDVLAGSRSKIAMAWKHRKFPSLGVDILGKMDQEEQPSIDVCASALLMIQAGMSVNFASLVSGMTALHWALMNNKRELVRILLLAGANPKIANYHGEGAFHFVPRPPA
ncbi:hypothetical protein HDU96_003940 [Phlyctochytrium bullatum]|nr:hypothetical protein HDU96_003940 [Phlyctochytrium bullatum]